MNFTPRPYQVIGRDFLLEHKRCALWAGMGMGKTSTTLSALDLLYLSGYESRPTLVLAPLRVARSTWPDEVTKWDDLRHIEVSPIVGTLKEREAALRKDVSVFTTNYEQLPWLVERFGERWPFGTVVSDESTKLKGFRLQQGSKRARALGQVAHAHVDRFIQLTGTPSPNGLIDLWGQAWFLDKGQRLGRSFNAFTSRWFQSIQVGADRHAVQLNPLPFAQEQIQEKLRDICLTLDPRDWFDLQEPIRSTVWVDLPSKARALYRDMEREFFMQLEQHGVEALNAASKSMKLRQLTSGAVYTDEKGEQWHEIHDAKLQALESIIEEAAGMPVMVVYQFRSDLERLLKAFPRGYDMATDDAKAFKTGKHPVGFAHAASLGHGVDGIQNVSNIICFFAHDWNLEQRQQIIERVGPVRQKQAGFDRPTFIYDIVARGTVDELVLARHETKRAVQDILLEAMKRRGRN